MCLIPLVTRKMCVCSIYGHTVLTYITKKHSSRMRTAHFSDSGRGLHKETQPPPLDRDQLWTETSPGEKPRDREPQTKTPGQRPLLDRDSPGQRLWTETPPDRDSPGQRLPWIETPHVINRSFLSETIVVYFKFSSDRSI